MEEYEALELSSSICTPVWNALELFGAQDNLLDGSNKSFFTVQNTIYTTD
jgi:hypothetical protein